MKTGAPTLIGRITRFVMSATIRHARLHIFQCHLKLHARLPCQVSCGQARHYREELVLGIKVNFVSRWSRERMQIECTSCELSWRLPRKPVSACLDP